LMFKQFTTCLIILISTLEIFSQSAQTVPNLELRWRFENSKLIDFKPFLSSEGLVISMLGGETALLDAESGNVLWTHESVGEIVSELLIKDGLVFVPTVSDSVKKTKTLTVISLKTGLTIRTESNLENTLTNEIASDNTKLSNPSQDNLFVTENTVSSKISGKTLWKTKVGGEINHIGVNRFGILVSSDDNYLYLLNPKNGNKIWKDRFTGKVLGTNYISEKIGIITVYGESKLQLFDVQKGKLLSFIGLQTDEYPTANMVGRTNRFYLGTNRGVLCFITK
jgi:outer membrane protein assembly factor BamB